MDILYNNIKHAVFQPCDGEMIIVLHFHLKVWPFLGFFGAFWGFLGFGVLYEGLFGVFLGFFGVFLGQFWALEMVFTVHFHLKVWAFLGAFLGVFCGFLGFFGAFWGPLGFGVFL